MRDLFRFLYRIRETLLFLALMIAAAVLLYSGNMHHRAIAINSSNALAGTLFRWRSQVTEYTSLREVNAGLVAENAEWRNRYGMSVAEHDSAGHPAGDSAIWQPFRFTSAKVVSATYHKPLNYLTLDQGSDAGLHADMGVVGPRGIVGVVRAVSPRFASVISVLNTDLRTSVKVKRTGHFGLLYWNTMDPATASVIDIPKHGRVREQDTIVTMGGDGIFPPGVPVGVVLRVESPPGRPDLDVRIRLLEDMARAGYVYVVEDRLRAERDSLEQQQPKR
jgi:rod shape-determining protein MreC